MNQQTEVKISRFEIAKPERATKMTNPELDNKMEKPDQNNRVAKFEMSKYKVSKFEIAKSEFTKVGGSFYDGFCSDGFCSDGTNLEGLYLQTLSKAPSPEVSNSQSAHSQSSNFDLASSETVNSEILPQQSPTEASNSSLLNPEILSLQDLHSQVLIANVKSLAQKEKALTMQIIDYLSEIARRRAYLPKYTSLFTFLVEELGYCPSTAMLRINAIKAFAAAPEIRKKVLDNKMSLNAVSRTQSFINQQMREDQNKNKRVLTKEEQRELFTAIENTPASQIEDTLYERKQELDARKAEAMGEPPPPREVRTQKVTLEVDGELLKMVEELKSLLSHTHPGASLSMLLKRVLPIALEKLKRDRGLVKVKRKATDLSSMESEKNWAAPRSSMKLGVRKWDEGQERTQKKVQSDSQSQDKSQDKSQVQSATDGTRKQLKTIKRSIPSSIKQLVWRRDHGCCQYRDPKSQKTCGSRHQVQFDHIKPWRIGGEHSSENLRLLCGIHNRHRSRSFGL